MHLTFGHMRLSISFPYRKIPLIFGKKWTESQLLFPTIIHSGKAIKGGRGKSPQLVCNELIKRRPRFSKRGNTAIVWAFSEVHRGHYRAEGILTDSGSEKAFFILTERLLNLRIEKYFC